MSGIIKKLSVKSIAGDVKKYILSNSFDNGTVIPVCTIVGIANDTQTGEGDNGPWVAFKGRFEGVSLMEPTAGQTVRSGKCFLPDVAGDLLEGQLAAEGVETVQFGFRIEAVVDDSAVVGYAYSATPLFEDKESDPLAELSAQANKSLEKLD